ncbi:hypothetical protein [Curtobacterium pusillum]|uniref:CBU_0592 family membrane protein n=1 Tax=Curtobacterium pusillum TaxID=69373 RepID=UPI001C92F776|nr:hypothetical protein [Curtobacterium pusillum]
MLSGIVEFLGWIGAVTVLAGYLLFSMGKLPNGPLYQLFNLVGGLAVAINVAAHHAIPSTIVNGIWAIVAVVVLVRMAKARRAERRGGPATVQPVLHTEPAATTAVLPVIGPALRDHEPEPTGPEATEQSDAAPRLQSVSGAPTAAAPMTESIPVITATIALALVAAAREQADQASQADPATHADQASHAGQADQATHADQPHHADSTPA